MSENAVTPAASLPGIPAAISRRFGAYIVDAMLGGVAFVLLLALGAAALGGLFEAIMFVELASIPLFAGYYLVCWARGATVGMRLLGLQVVDNETLQPIGFGRAFVRYLVLSLAGGFTCGIGLVVMLIMGSSHPRRQMWHDLAAKSVVIQKEGSVAPKPPAPPKATGLVPVVMPGTGEAVPAPAAPVALPVAAVAIPAPAAPTGLVSPPPGFTPPPPPPAVPPPPPSPSSAAMPMADLSVIDERTRAAAPRQLGWALTASGAVQRVTGPVLIGRDPDSALVDGATTWQVDDPDRTVSKTHALVDTENDQLWVEDLDSTNGVAIRRAGAEIELVARVRTPLVGGDEVLLGDFAIVVRKPGE